MSDQTTTTVVVLPPGPSTPTTRRASALVRELDSRSDVQVITLLWDGGPGEDLRGLGGLVDCGAVNRWWPASVLRRVGLGRLGQALKSRRLGAMLSDLPARSLVYVAGPQALPALAWIDRVGSVVLQVSGSDLGNEGGPALIAASDEATLVVATDLQADAWATVGGVTGSRLRRWALLEPTGTPPPEANDGDIGVVGGDAELLGRVAFDLVRDAPETTVWWFIEQEQSWSLWQGRSVPPLAGRIEVVEPDDLTDVLPHLRTIVVAQGIRDPEIEARAGLYGVTVIEEPGPGEPIDRPGDQQAPADDWVLAVGDGVEALLTEIRAPGSQLRTREP